MGVRSIEFPAKERGFAMALTYLLLASLLVPQTSPQEAAPVVVPTRPVEVTVYPEEALVRRTAVVKVERGETRLEITDLPTLMKDESVRVRATNATVVSVNVVPSYKTQSSSATVEALRKERDEKHRERGLLEDARNAQKMLLEFLVSVKVEAPKQAGQSVLSGQQLPLAPSSVLEFLGSNAPKVYAEMRRIHERDVLLAAEIANLDKRLGDLESGRVVPVKAIHLELAANGAADAQIEVAYLIGNAGWRASHDVRAESNLKGATMIAYGVVVQKTGEDWSDVRLNFSTARPERGAEPPRLRPWELTPPPVDQYGYMDRSRAPSGSARKAPKSAELKQEVAAEAERPAESPLPDLAVDAEVVSSGLSTQFIVPRKESVPADGRPHRIRMGEVALQFDPVHVATPVAAKGAFVRAKPKNTAAWPILASPAQVFVGSDFVGRIALPDVPVGEVFELYLGADPGIVVERFKDRADREAPGFLGSRVTWNFAWRITVKNAGAATGPASVEIIERIPISRDDRIKVELAKIDPPFARGEKEDKERETEGILRFRMNLAPGETRTISVAYTVSAPENLPVQGLELK